MTLNPCSSSSGPTIIGTITVTGWMVLILQSFVVCFTLYKTCNCFPEHSKTPRNSVQQNLTPGSSNRSSAVRSSPRGSGTHMRPSPRGSSNSREFNFSRPSKNVQSTPKSLKIALILYQCGFLLQISIMVCLFGFWSFTGDIVSESSFQCHLQFGATFMSFVYYYTMIFFWHARLNVVYKKSRFEISKKFNIIFGTFVTFTIIVVIVLSLLMLISTLGAPSKQEAFCSFEVQVSYIYIVYSICCYTIVCCNC